MTFKSRKHVWWIPNYLSCIKKYFGDKTITMESLMDLLLNELDESVESNDVDIVRAFFGYALCAVYFPMRDGDGVFTGFCPILDYLKLCTIMRGGK